VSLGKRYRAFIEKGTRAQIDDGEKKVFGLRGGGDYERDLLGESAI